MKQGDSYTGYASLRFFLNAVPENEGDLFLNFQVKAISEYTVNGQVHKDAEDFTNHKLRLQNANLKAGWNTVSLKYFQLYSDQQVGLHSYIDKQDNR